MKFVLLFLLCALAGARLHGQGMIRATTTMHADGSKSNTVVDPEKMTAEETVIDAAGRTIRKVTYLLDEQSQPIGSITYDPKGAILYRVSYKRDGTGRIEEENVTSPTGEFVRRRVYTYGAQNKVTNMVEYDAQGNVIPRAARRPATPSQARPDRKKK
jgi:hypothetical protein